jgi:deoxyribodipyrimidine photolyase-related protein
VPLAQLVYPHQIYPTLPVVGKTGCVVLVEDPLFFTHYPFHRQKLMLHRASMKKYEAKLLASGVKVRYLDSADVPNAPSLAAQLRRWKITEVRVYDLCDDWLDRRLSSALAECEIRRTTEPDPHFLTSRNQIEQYVAGRKKFFFTDFYMQQRKRLNILLEDGKPTGGKWSFDPENRKKLPPKVVPPAISYPAEDDFAREARQYVTTHFPKALGENLPLRYPTDTLTAEAWLGRFLEQRLEQFGDYEDAMSTQHDVAFHSLLTPMMNIGLISPQQVVNAVLERADRVPLNSLEGFLRQVIGWREFVRLIYLTHGREQRQANYWNLTHPLPGALYTGTTGIVPVDHTIQQVLRTGYCHHIERLMVLGNFLLLCDIHPNAVYRWFMELFVDAYDWVMVPNVYGMSQYSDGGRMTTKPYVSGSSYILRMSDFKKGPWCEVWDGLYWRFVHRNTAFFAGNPRLAMMAKMKDKLGEKLTQHLRIADAFLVQLHSSG